MPHWNIGSLRFCATRNLLNWEVLYHKIRLFEHITGIVWDSSPQMCHETITYSEVFVAQTLQFGGMVQEGEQERGHNRTNERLDLTSSWQSTSIFSPQTGRVPSPFSVTWHEILRRDPLEVFGRWRP